MLAIHPFNVSIYSNYFVSECGLTLVRRKGGIRVRPAMHVTPAKPATFVQPPLGPPCHHHRDSDMRDKEPGLG